MYIFPLEYPSIGMQIVLIINSVMAMIKKHGIAFRFRYLQPINQLNISVQTYDSNLCLMQKKYVWQ